MKDTHYLKEYVSNNIKHHRQHQGLSQEKLSDMAGIGLKYINQIENHNHNVSLATLEKIISALGLSVEEFFHFGALEKEEGARGQSWRRLSSKITHLSEQKQEALLGLFEGIVDQID